jgi:hypothetical protein
MAVYTCPVAASADDYDTNSNGAQLTAKAINSSPQIIWTININVLTSSIPNDYSKIISATFAVYEYSYTASKGLAKTYNLFTMDNASIQVGSSVRTYAGGWATYTLPPSLFPYIYRGTGAYTYFYIGLSMPTANNESRVMVLNGYNTSPSPLYASVLTVTTAAAEHCQSIIAG